jgi:NAD(P)-dependent dehydrogenase (short-subunit alcohol dehydrogenase family)
MAKGLFDLSGKVALITGGNSGIGLGFARGIAGQGGSIAIWARNAEKNAAAKAELLDLGAPRVETYQIDVSGEEPVIAGYDRFLADFGRVDFVFANSGRSSNGRSVLTIETSEWYDLLEVNLHGAFFTLREGARRMVERAKAGEPGGSLVFCGSLSMFQGIAGHVNYTASKGGLGAVIRAMAVELGQYGIRANTVAPGYVKTSIGGGGDAPPAELIAQIDGFFSSKTPIHRPGLPSDFEGIAAYLCSDASSFHSGDTIVIDGGSLVNPSYAM